MTHVSTKHNTLVGVLLIIVGSVAIFLVAQIALSQLYNMIIAGTEQIWWYGRIETASIALVSTFSILFYSRFIIKKFLRR